MKSSGLKMTCQSKSRYKHRISIQTITQWWQQLLRWYFGARSSVDQLSKSPVLLIFQRYTILCTTLFAMGIVSLRLVVVDVNTVMSILQILDRVHQTLQRLRSAAVAPKVLGAIWGHGWEVWVHQPPCRWPACPTPPDMTWCAPVNIQKNQGE